MTEVAVATSRAAVIFRPLSVSVYFLWFGCFFIKPCSRRRRSCWLIRADSCLPDLPFAQAVPAKILWSFLFVIACISEAGSEMAHNNSLSFPNTSRESTFFLADYWRSYRRQQLTQPGLFLNCRHMPGKPVEDVLCNLNPGRSVSNNLAYRQEPFGFGHYRTSHCWCRPSAARAARQTFVRDIISGCVFLNDCSSALTGLPKYSRIRSPFSVTNAWS